MRVCLAFAATLLLPAACLAQAIDVTAPFAPGEHITSAAGMPLNDGALMPGTLTVRVVRGGFAGNLSGRDVVLDVLGGPTRKARTDGQGRAVFTDVPVDAHVRASVRVDDERLQSAVFPMPAQNGVRVLLTTGASGADAQAADDPPGTLPLETVAALMRNGDGRPARSPDAQPADRGFLMASILGALALGFGATMIRRSRSSGVS